MDIAIATSAWGNYGRYLPEWAGSIAEQTMKPSEVVIMDAGLDDPLGIDEAFDILRDAGIRLRRGTMRRTTIGSARNAAVALCNTEWVSHLDADDLFTPHAIEDIAELQAEADVIAFGCLRDGQEITFPRASAEMILASQVCVYSCGAFRRSLWKQRPWQELNDWCDSTYWVGLAHLGARFASTGKVGFVYRQHHDSVSHTITPRQKQFAIEQWKKSIREWQF